MANLSKHRKLGMRKSWQERAELWREKIKVSAIITTLDRHVRGEIEMSPSRVKAAQVLLDRVMPTLSASEITRRNETVSPEELIERIRSRYGDALAEQLAKDYVPHHAPGHA